MEEHRVVHIKNALKVSSPEHHLRITTPTQILPASAGGTTQIGNFVAGATAETQAAEIARRKRWERAPKATRMNRQAAAWKQQRSKATKKLRYSHD